MKYENLKLGNQICFPIYAASRLITREYQPYLDKLGITYPQYLVLLLLWEYSSLTVNSIAERLYLNTNTITPLLKRMENIGIVKREKSKEDERKVIVSLTKKGMAMKDKAILIPEKLATGLIDSGINYEALISLKNNLYKIINMLSENSKAI